MESALFSCFKENLRPVSRFWELWRRKARFGQNVLRMTWKERFVQFLWKAHCFPFLKRNLCRCDDFENFDGQNCDLAKTCCACPEKSVLYNFLESALFSRFGENFRPCEDFENLHGEKCDLAKTCSSWPKKSVLHNFHGKRTVFLFWREYHANVRILRTLSVKMRFGQKVLRMSWKERFVQFWWIALCFPVLARILGQCDDFKNFHAQKCDLAKTCCAWAEKSVLYNFYEKRTVFPFWREI